MTAPHAGRIIDGYLAQLEAELSSLPRARRREIIAEVQSHITEARAQLANETDADLHNLLDRLGDPSQVAAEAGVATAPTRAGGLEIGAVVLTPIIWPVGVMLLWLSPAWRTRDKLIGTLVPPGGYPGLVIFGSWFTFVRAGVGQTCSNGVCSPPGAVVAALIALHIALFLFLAALPALTGIYLAVTLRRRYRADSSIHASTFQGARG
jgi:hypothetical protein